ncbi:Tox-REase-5 domain-containing protein [Streptomyces sp. NPDC058280]|uniref:Tox-REase-5 domain-containing protein n=1 Tax=Streptomyces sp. NPDC058280 TaxID=3346419 RepID=UPI0036EBD0DD
MSAFGGISAYGGAVPARGGGRRPLPRPLAVARVLLHVLFGVTVVGGLGLFGSALAAGAMGGRLLGLALYAAAPGVVAWLLARRVWTGGTGVWWSLIAVQVWLILGGLSNIGDGSGHGFTQLFLPVLILLFLTRAASREWFRLPRGEREEKPAFSLPHMITWRRDRGQTAVEYVGMITIVAAIIVALVAGGIGGRIGDGIRSAICSATGTACPSPGDDSGTVEAGGDQDPGGEQDPGEADTGGADAGGTDAGSSDTGGTDGSGGTDGDTTGGTDGGTASIGGATGSGGTNGSGDTADTGDSTGTGTGDATGAGGSVGGPGDPTNGDPTTGGSTGGSDTYPETGVEPEAEYDDTPSATEEESGESGGGDGGTEGGGGGEKADKEDCGGWGFVGCAWDRGTQVVKGVFVDGIWGDVTGIVDLVKPETWSGMADYGGQLGDQWMEDSKGAVDKFKDGDYLGALGDWGGASVNTVVKVGDDVFVGDEVRERWDNGEKTRAATDVVWNIGSLFIPGYDVAKVVGKVGKLGKLGKIAEEVAEAAADAGDAARRARKAAEAGDVDGARKAAKEADEAADKAEDQARKTGCAIASGPLPRHGFTGVGGSGTGVLAGGSPGRVILAEDGCDTEAAAKAKEAREQERAAHLEQKRAEEPDRAAKAELEKKKWPTPEHGDTSDPRNYNAPDWADDLNSPDLGSADKGDGFWAGRDRNPKPNWKNESWLRYQEQVTGTVRGKEYVVPHPKEGKPAVEYDGWDSNRQTFLEAKNGYESYLSKTEKGALTDSGKQKFIDEATRQVEASGGRAIEWHFSNPEVAKAARKAFREKELPIKVVETPQKPAGGSRKPEAFD